MVVLEDRCPLNRGSIHMTFLWQDKKIWPINRDDCLTEVTAWAGLTVYVLQNYFDTKSTFKQFNNNNYVQASRILKITNYQLGEKTE